MLYAKGSLCSFHRAAQGSVGESQSALMALHQKRWLSAVFFHPDSLLQR
jgi:hypothetical protein